MTTYTATYSPDDNKIRLYASSRLDAETYARVRAAGFIWAPKQELFVAPMWTPKRADLAEELAGEIGDEDTSLADRAEARADRFEDYSDKRADDAESARRHVASIADGIPLGQPILIGHHSEKHARRDAEKIENGMRRAVRMWETSQYWTQRAAGALRHAKYLERADVRARRIKKLEAEKRKQEKYRTDAENWLKLWIKDGLTLAQARAIANVCWLTVTHTNADGTPNTNGGWKAYDVLRDDEERFKACPACTVAQVQDAARSAYPRTIAHAARWIAHYENRLAYERAMLGEQGGTVADQTGPETGGACRCWASKPGAWSYIVKRNKVSVSLLDNWGNGGANFKRTIPFDKLKAVMTKAQVDEARANGLTRETGDGTGFYLLDAPATDQPPNRTAKPRPAPQQTAQADIFAGMRDSLAAGIQVVTAPQLFPTPADLAARMVEIADIQPGAQVLEPSGGGGAIIRAVKASAGPDVDLTAVEIKPQLADVIRTAYRTPVFCKDFLQCNGEMGMFDRIIMNPPFANGADIQHIKHAAGFLKPGGRLVAICANGPRQRAELMPLADTWEDLPAGTFAEQGTNVNTALLVIEG